MTGAAPQPTTLQRARRNVAAHSRLPAELIKCASQRQLNSLQRSGSVPQVLLLAWRLVAKAQAVSRISSEDEWMSEKSSLESEQSSRGVQRRKRSVSMDDEREQGLSAREEKVRWAEEAHSEASAEQGYNRGESEFVRKSELLDILKSSLDFFVVGVTEKIGALANEVHELRRRVDDLDQMTGSLALDASGPQTRILMLEERIERLVSLVGDAATWHEERVP